MSPNYEYCFNSWWSSQMKEIVEILSLFDFSPRKNLLNHTEIDLPIQGDNKILSMKSVLELLIHLS